MVCKKIFSSREHVFFASLTVDIDINRLSMDLGVECSWRTLDHHLRTVDDVAIPHLQQSFSCRDDATDTVTEFHEWLGSVLCDIDL